MSQEAAAQEINNYDLINVCGPLTIDAILKALQQRFTAGHNYVSTVETKHSERYRCGRY